MSYYEKEELEYEPFIATPDFVSKWFNEFIEWYDKFKKHGLINNLNAAEFYMRDLAMTFRYKGNYEIVRSVNPKAAHFLKELYDNGTPDAVNVKHPHCISIHDLKKYRECFD